MRERSASGVRRRAGALLFGLGATLAGACENGGDESSGALVVVVETELALPKDLDQLRLEVSQYGRVVFQEEHALGPDDMKLPASFRIVAGKDAGPVLIRGVGSKEGTPRIQRDAVTPIPRDYVGQLRLPLNYLCDGTAETDGSSTCAEDDETCVLGSCKPSAVPTPTAGVDVSFAKGEGQSAEPGSGCFDVLACFAEALELELDATDCTARVPDGVEEEVLNVALRAPAGGAGICDDNACWNSLVRADAASSEGYRVDRGQILMPEGVCEERERLGFELFASGLCYSRTARNPVCSEASSVEMPVEQPELPHAVGGACTGPAERACGACGTQTRSCKNGAWSAFSACAGERACEPDSVESCGDGGTRACGGNCEWGPCSDQRCIGPAARACGNCGTQTRTCAGTTWSAWSQCTGEGVCAPNATEACESGGIRACGGSCEWGACSDPECEGPASQACEQCGTRTRTCSAGVWSEWSECAGQGECEPNSTLECGNGGTLACGGDCRFSECTGQICDGSPTRSCGNCGTQSRTCDNGTWLDWSNCSGEGVCDPNSERSCGEGGSQVCGGACRWGECLNQVCPGPATQSCGSACGTQSRVCSDGLWSDWSACREGVCVPNTTRVCIEGNGIQTCLLDCSWGNCLMMGGGTGGSGGTGGTSVGGRSSTLGGMTSTGGNSDDDTGGNEPGGGTPATGGTETGGNDTGGTGTGGTTGSGEGGTAGETSSGGSSGSGGEGGVASSDCPTAGGSMVLLPDGYCIDATEVTRGAYEAWRTSTGALTDHASCSWKDSLSSAGDSPEQSPATMVDWCDAVSFCDAMGKRLCGRIGGGPNVTADAFDAEFDQWFNACSTGGAYEYQYGNDFDSAACNAANVSPGSVAVASMSACQSPDPDYAGVYDLSGNVWEWQDLCLGSAQTSGCYIRGGSWVSMADTACGVSAQARTSRSIQTGFRCCAD